MLKKCLNKIVAISAFMVVRPNALWRADWKLIDMRASITITNHRHPWFSHTVDFTCDYDADHYHAGVHILVEGKSWEELHEAGWVGGKGCMDFELKALGQV